MVLPRDQPIQIWGWADHGVEVTVRFAEHCVQTRTDKDGSWAVTLQAMRASDAGQQLRIDGGGQSIVIHDVLMGDIWHASGQSNMAMTVGAMANELPRVTSDIAAADLPTIRFCRIDEAESVQPLIDLQNPANWTPCSPISVSSFSGVAFYFARHLHNELKVPIGIIDSSRGGTPIEPYIPRSAFASHATLLRELEFADLGDLDGIWKMPGGVRARDANWLPGRLFNSRLAPITRLHLRGTIWYQGESNCGEQEDPRNYQYKMQALINGWRQAWGNPTLPVYFVQLPGSGAGEGWPYLREQQRLAADIPHTGMVVTIDIDGAGIHPANKIDVGQRLAVWALAKQYQKRVAFSGPMFDRQIIQDDKIVVQFTHSEGGLMVASKVGLSPPLETKDAPLAHFELTDGNGQWQSAAAEIVGKAVVVSSRQVQSPVAVRYAYSVTPDHRHLYNRDGLPASPFCSQSTLLDYDPKLPK